MPYFTFETELKFMDEAFAREFIETTQAYLDENDPLEMSEAESDRYWRKSEALDAAKRKYNSYVKDGTWPSYKGKEPYKI